MEAFRDMVTGWLGKTLLVFLVVPFAIFGIESYFAGGGKVTAARVNGEDILQRDVDHLAEQQRQQLATHNANPADIDMARIRKDVLNGMIDQDLLTQQANSDGYLISDSTVYKLIRDLPAFQENGAFSQTRYEQVLRQSGESPASFPATLKKKLAYSLLLSGLGQSAFVTNAELGRFSSLDGQTRDIHVAMVPAARYLADIKVGDDDVRKYYDANPSRFTAPETVALEYITLKRDDLLAQAAPTDDELQSRYQDHVSSLLSNEQRQAQHILITVDAKTKDADALKKIQEIEKRARAGEDFGKLAKEFSQDPGSVAAGGDLGMVARGQFTPEFDKALFGMKEGEISAPVRSQYGYHLIKLNKIQKPAVPSFAELKPTLEKEAREAKADELFSDLSDKIDAAVYEASDLKDPSEKFKLAIAGTGPFSRNDGKGIAADRKVIDAAFSDDLLKDGKNSQGIHLSDNTIVWLHVKSHDPSRLKPFVEVAAEARSLLVLERAREKAASVAAALVKALNGGETLAEAADREKLSWQDYADATHRTQIPLPDALKTAFRLPRPATGKVSADSIDAGGSYAVVAVSKVTEGSSQPAPAISQLRNVLSESRSQQEYRDYVRFLRDSGKVVISMKTTSGSPAE